MNGFHDLPQPPSAWQEHRTPDGRAYYYNTLTKVTQWTKPEEMMAPAERALTGQPWKEYTAEGGRKYWYNTESKQSSWEMPDAYRNALGASGPPDATASPAPVTPSPANNASAYDAPRDRRDYPETRHDRFLPDSRPQAFVPANDDPEHSTFEEAEAAFIKALKRASVQPDWSWEQAIRATIRDPQFRAIKDPKDRKQAFEKYCQDVIVQDKERAHERLTKLRTDFETMLKRHPEITHYTRWKTARPMIAGEAIFRSTNNENERRQLFGEYIAGLKKAHADKQTSMRKNAMDGLIELLPQLNLEPYTRWFQAQDIISATQPFRSDEKYRALSQFDILTVFQNHMKALERSFNDSKQQEKNMKFRSERKARDNFKGLLGELRRDGKMTVASKWSVIVPLIEKDPRYTNMAGHGGSTPQELFWDIVEEQERSLRGPRNDVIDVLEDKRFELSSSTDLEEYMALMKDDRRTANIDREILKHIFERLREKRASKRDDDRQSDRHQRRQIDDFRSFLKRLEPPIVLGDTYEKICSRLLKSEEFQAITSEDARHNAFDKHMRRLKEKDEDTERSHRRRDRGSTERDLHRRDRSRSRGERHHRGSGRGSRRSHSPEVDAYEADRRKAIAEREKNHRKSTMAENLLSTDRGRLSPPLRREREREREREPRGERERERDYERRPRPRRDDDSYYDRERRDREDERERLYRRRADRGGSYDELPYGDERPPAPRRRRPEDEDDVDRKDPREVKRVKRERSRERTPPRESRPRNPTPPPQAPPKDVHSGSEEGEIEEDD